MPLFNLHLKNEGHDIEDQVRAVTASDAAYLFADKYDIDVSDAIANLLEVEEEDPRDYD